MKRSLILGVGGQDGSYLAEILVDRGDQVHGLYRRTSVDNLHRISSVRDKVKLWMGDITDANSLGEVVREVCPDEIYNVADQDHIGWSYKIPKVSLDVTLGGVLNLLEIVKNLKHIRVFQPVSSTIFGNADPPQNEKTPLSPQSPYACMKAGVYHLCNYYREVYELQIVTGIMFNHDSPRRKKEGYLLQELAAGAIAVKRGLSGRMLVGALDMRVDIGFAREYMTAVINLVHLASPGNYVIGTGVGWTIGGLASGALARMDLDPSLVGINPSFARPGPQPKLIADIGQVSKIIEFLPKEDAMSVLKMLIDSNIRELR